MASGGKQPKPVDPNVAAEAQARWNRTGQVTPFGTVQWDGNNQVSTPSDAMMAMFNQAQGIAQGGGQQYKPPSNFGDIQSSIMSRLQENTYQPGSRAVDSKPDMDQTSLAKGTPGRDAFLGEKDPVTGERRTIRHILRGGLQGSIPRFIGNMVDEYRDRKLPGQASLGQPENSPIGGTPFAMPDDMGTRPIQRQRGMPGPVGLDPIAPSSIERIGMDKPVATLPARRGIGRKPTKAERRAWRNDPNSILGRGASNMQPLFTSPTAALFNQYDHQGAGDSFDATVAAYARMLKPTQGQQR